MVSIPLPPCETRIVIEFSYLGETEFLDVWDDAYATIMRYTRAKDGYWVYQYFVLNFCDTEIDLILQYKTVNMHSGDVAYNTIDSLSAFWPGLQVLSGDIQSAIKLHMMCMFDDIPSYPFNDKH